MAPVVEEFPLHRFTQDDAIALYEVLDLQRVELLHGVFVEQLMPGAPHDAIVARLTMWLARGVDPERLLVRPNADLRVRDPQSMPIPDLMVCDAGSGYVHDHPRAAHLVIEVADSSLRRDRDVKAPLYGATRVPEYWIVDVQARTVIVHTEPSANGYDSRHTLSRSDRAAPAHVDIEPLELERLFGGFD